MKLIRTLHRYLIRQAMPGWAVYYYEQLINDVAPIYFDSLVKEIMRHVTAGSVIIDAGAGTGQLPIIISEKLANCTIAGLDLSFACLSTGSRTARNKGIKAAYIQADLERSPLKRGTVDLIVSTCSLHHWRRPVKVLREMSALLKPGGLILLMDMAADAPIEASRDWIRKVTSCAHSSSLFRIVFPFERKFLSYSLDEVRQMCEAAGVQVEELRLAGAFMAVRLQRSS
jgi:ubiquinone/menaquinone biosynthesis C-methylase UbiE